MVSAVTTDHLSSVLKVMSFDFDPDETAPTDVSWQDFRDFGSFLCQVFRSVGTGSLTSFKILANPESDGSGTDQEVKEHALGTAPDAVGDFVNLECLASEFPPLASGLRHISANISLVTATDECVVVYVFGLPRFAHQDLTADTIA